ncbi:hypothetical protein L1857_28160 [Amycolatopsis thermalba]|uniref:DUF4190 domain-containing protein n=1 Tax=Amycolatopsis thermalba TaxID=944492 RepID=A0ABY4P284_9PSEU|nr:MULTISPECIES: hypothetical protein [Amycolatopsis]UQS26414.1 hypothetical protein L1857_28160 [Amycolatopsis thermalba]
MTEDRRPGVAFLGFALATGLLIVVVVALMRDFVAGWHGGEYASAYIGVTFGAMIAGSLCRLARPPWRSFGTGLILGGVLGFASFLAVAVALYLALSQMSS